MLPGAALGRGSLKCVLLVAAHAAVATAWHTAAAAAGVGMRAMRCACSPLHQAVGNERRVHAATQAWLDEWVINQNLCPWAKLTKGSTLAGDSYTRILTMWGGEDSMAEHAAAVQREADALRQRVQHGNGRNGSFFTTLLVFPDTAYLGSGPDAPHCGAFPVRKRAATGLVTKRANPACFDAYWTCTRSCCGAPSRKSRARVNTQSCWCI